MVIAIFVLLLSWLPSQGLPQTDSPVPPDTVIELERYGGFGNRLRYKLKILANGATIIEGVVWGKPVGPKTGAIRAEAVKKLIAEFNRIDYFSYQQSYRTKPECPSEGKDAVTVITSLKTNGRSKWVLHSHGCQGAAGLEKLTSLEKLIEAIAEVGQLRQSR